MGRTRLRELTRPRKARTDFLLSGNLKSFTFCTLRGSAIFRTSEADQGGGRGCRERAWGSFEEFRRLTVAFPQGEIIFSAKLNRF